MVGWDWPIDSDGLDLEIITEFNLMEITATSTDPIFTEEGWTFYTSRMFAPDPEREPNHENRLHAFIPVEKGKTYIFGARTYDKHGARSGAAISGELVAPF